MRWKWILFAGIDADVDARGRGDSIDAIIGSLNGKTVLAMSNGKIHNKYIGLLGADISSSLVRLLSLSPQELQYTPVNCFVGGFNIKNGLAETTALVLDTDQMSVIGDGEINLKTEKLDLGLNSVPKGGIGTSTTGKVTASLGQMVGGTMPMGPVGLAAPFIKSGGADKNLCPAAIEAGRKGIKMSALAKQEKKGVVNTVELPEAGLQELGKGLKKLFGK